MNREFHGFSSTFCWKNNRNTIYYFFLFLLFSPFLFGQASFPYYEDFEGSGDKGWIFANGTQPNKWVVGSAVSNGGSRALYISNDGGLNFSYTRTIASTSHAYRDITIPTGTTTAYITFDWRANGEASSDYLEVWLVPSSFSPTDGNLITSAADRIKLGTYNLKNSFNFSSNLNNLSIFAGMNMRVVFTWRNNSSGGSQSPAAIDNFSVTTYCKPTSSNPSSLYIREFQFVGTLNNVSANVQTGTAAYSNGYQDYTSLTPAQQPQNAAMNITAKTNGTTGGSWKAWVDWNRDGDFSDAGEEIYKMIGWTTPSITFGFIIPPTALGVYRLRIGTKSSASDFGNCDNLTGEYEDYLFEAVVDCSAKVITINDVNAFDGERCGPGSVRISATGNASAVDYKWYDSIYGGNLLGTGNTYNTPVISTATTYYVTAVSSTGCETAYRYPVVARIDPQPTVTFSTDKPAICGEDEPTLLVTAAGDKYQDVIFEKFDSGLGVFNNIVAGAYTNPLGDWMNKPSPYIPTVAEGYAGTSPAFSSGYFGGNYAIINSDISRTTNVLNYMESNNLDISGYINLKLDFDMYHFSIATSTAQGYVAVDYSLDSGATWNNLTTFFNDEGNPFNWRKFSFDIPGSNFTSTQFKIRFTHFSAAASGVFYEAITTVDNVRLYGFKSISTPFKWNSGVTTIYDTDCVTPLPINDLRSTVCIKPTPTELEDLNWNLNANATFSNGCPADGYYDVNNDTKTWRQPGIIDWNQGAQWRPLNVPDITKCVIVRTPVELPANTNGSHGLARSVIVKPGGSLIIQPKSSLTIQNHIKNETVASDVIVDSDANLKQNNDAAINSGNITVYRNAQLKRLDYNYWGTPVTGQNIRNFSINTLTNRFYVYREKDDFFDGIFAYSSYLGFTTVDAFPLQSTETYNFELGKGYAIRAPNDFTDTVTNFNGTFVGVPNNGVVNIPIVCSNCSVLPPPKGNNLISNPYPSNIDFEQLYILNSGLIYNTYFVWTNTNYNPKMQGENYPGVGIINNYALYNATGGLSAPYGFTGLGTNTPVTPASPPNRYIKVGQGFIVKAKGNGTLTLNNTMRSTDNTANFFNRMGSNEPLIDRFWLSLKTPLDFVSPILIGYKKGASNRYEMDYDAEHVVIGSDSFYSLLDNKKLAIQGRYPFQIEDSIPLGTNYYESGIHTISLDRAEGVFANGQSIYLKDNFTGVVTNLSQSPYTFTADAGEVNNRFEIIYNYKTLGSNEASQKEPVVIYKEDNGFVINANEVITSVKLFDATGRLVNEQKVEAKSTKIIFSNTQKGVFLVEIITPSKRYTKKIIN